MLKFRVVSGQRKRGGMVRILNVCDLNLDARKNVVEKRKVNFLRIYLGIYLCCT